VESVELVMDKANPTLNRGFCFVTYYNHACAEAARKHFSEPDHSR
jgi:heterogeneous nuclear ribonucleoprotein R